MARQRILDAAATMAEEEGAQALSLERVAERAGVSKGGLLYHFRSKEALLTAMLQSMIECHDDALDSRVSVGERYVTAVLDHSLEKHDKPGNLIAAFIAAVATDRGAQEMMREKKKRWYAALRADGLSEAQALVLSLALDGLFIGTSLGVTELTCEQRAVLREALEKIVQPSEEERLADWFQQALQLVEA